MVIKNYHELATSPLRKAALNILEAGLRALQSEEIIRQHIQREGNLLAIKNQRLDLSRFNRVFVVGFGKAATGMGRAMEEILDDKLTGGFILDRKKGDFRQLTALVGTHPDPTTQNVEATQEILDFLRGLDAKTLVFVLISGGGSALFTSPHRILVEEKAELARKLMKAGATINELNVVRKHLSEVKGGKLAKLCYPATVVSLLLSDVVGDDPATIASGPTALDPSTVDEARQILQKYNLPAPELVETPKDERFFERVTNVVLANASAVLPPMAQQARAEGWQPQEKSSLTGDADKVGRIFLDKVKAGEALLSVGETTVKVKGKGQGGRNQQLVLAALPDLTKGQLIASLNTDGHDNSDHAGALGDVETLKKADTRKLSLAKFAADNNAYPFFKAVGDGIVTGELDSNFADILVCLSART